MAHIIADRIMETAVTTGLGDITLDGAVAGYLQFDQACASGDSVFYCIQAVNASGVPTGQWEIGKGVFTVGGTRTLSRGTLLSSSTNDSQFINFAAGTKQVYLTVPAEQVNWAVERPLYSGVDFYVSTTGDDNNDGRTVGTPFLTITAAVTAATTMVAQGFNFAPAINLADGTYEEPVEFPATVGELIIRGNVTTPANVVITSVDSPTLVFYGKGNYTLVGVTLTNSCETPSAAYCLQLVRGAYVSLNKVVFGSALGGHILVDNSTLYDQGTSSIVGSAPFHLKAITGSIVDWTYGAVTLTGTPAFSTAFVVATTCSVITGAPTFTGTATGKRYDITQNSVLNSTATTFPGSVAGTTATGGVYA